MHSAISIFISTSLLWLHLLADSKQVEQVITLARYSVQKIVAGKHDFCIMQRYKHHSITSSECYCWHISQHIHILLSVNISRLAHRISSLNYVLKSSSSISTLTTISSCLQHHKTHQVSAQRTEAQLGDKFLRKLEWRWNTGLWKTNDVFSWFEHSAWIWQSVCAPCK